MFKKFDDRESVSGNIQMKSSVQKAIKAKLLDQYPYIEAYISSIMPKKETLKIVKCHDHIELLANQSGELLFFRHREGRYMPTLRLIHKYPFLLPPLQVDKGAIRFILSGANIMCPGLTSPGAKLTSVPKDTPVAIMAEGKQHAVCIGLTKMSTDEMQSVNKGIGVDNLHYLNDGLWYMKAIK
ncbi:PREDICTED: malignant T-cell-amplified sequence 1-B-like [Priapulus caudatus]|uniref:Malignant T-cell-amplified sequence 1-B-like n=1 Tax=Priapulus caudatus TaxID=37621 RepID=A0ABM1EA93_PRICU|nr:PREDICTED: malignant T-cell-amplified sequence 1-B-like [Priapulus caudatus]